MSAQQKQHLAKGLGLVPNTVQEVLEWMANSKQHSKVQPQKTLQLQKAPEKVKKAEKPKKVQKEDSEKPEEKSGDSESEVEDSDDSDAEEAPEEVAKTEEAPKAKDSGAKKVQKEDSDESDAAEESDDSTDEESEEPVAKKPKLAPSALKTNDKIDKEIKKLEEDEDNESPEIRRQIALLRLQKKLKEMKQDRKGKGPAKVTAAMADKLAEEKRLKRRESKLKLKQRRAEEKKGKAEGAVKKEKVSICILFGIFRFSKFNASFRRKYSVYSNFKKHFFRSKSRRRQRTTVKKRNRASLSTI